MDLPVCFGPPIVFIFSNAFLPACFGPLAVLASFEDSGRATAEKALHFLTPDFNTAIVYFNTINTRIAAGGAGVERSLKAFEVCILFKQPVQPFVSCFP